jgi:4-aminobutyrate aminotransferase/(S)-3-amino-2-methylpropionate transaminase
MIAIEFADGEGLAPRPDLASGLLRAALERHLLLLPCGTHGQVVRIIPPLVTTDTEVDDAVGIIEESLASIGA